MRQRRWVPWCHYPLEFTPVFSQVPAEIPTGHLSRSLSGCRWGDLYQGASRNSAGIRARIKTSKQNWMKSAVTGTPTNPIFHFHLTSTSAKFFQKDQRSSRSWSSLVVYEYIRTCERNRPSPKHSYGWCPQLSVNYVFFLAAGSLLLFQTHTFLPKSFLYSRTLLIHNIIWYRAPIFTFLTFIIVKGKKQRQQQKTKQTNKRKIKTKKLPLKTPKQTAIFIYYFSLSFFLPMYLALSLT